MQFVPPPWPWQKASALSVEMVVVRTGLAVAAVDARAAAANIAGTIVAMDLVRMSSSMRRLVVLVQQRSPRHFVGGGVRWSRTSQPVMSPLLQCALTRPPPYRPRGGGVR